jgi:hypothetical protein
MERYSKKYPSKWQSQYSDEFKQHVCTDFLTGSLTRRQVEKKYKIGNSRLTCWLKDIGYDYSQARLVPLSGMPEESKPIKTKSASEKKLERDLEDAKLLAEAYKRIIEKAEQELKIDIRKKSNTK